MVTMYPAITIKTKRSLPSITKSGDFGRNFMLSFFCDIDMDSTLSQAALGGTTLTSVV
jgi:hypothetical protein